jgi:hypothetical protein
MKTNDLLVRATVVLHFLTVRMQKAMVMIFAQTAETPIDQDRPFNTEPSSISFEHSSLHSSDKSKQSIFPSHLLVIGM